MVPFWLMKFKQSFSNNNNCINHKAIHCLQSSQWLRLMKFKSPSLLHYWWLSPCPTFTYPCGSPCKHVLYFRSYLILPTKPHTANSPCCFLSLPSLCLESLLPLTSLINNKDYQELFSFLQPSFHLARVSQLVSNQNLHLFLS